MASRSFAVQSRKLIGRRIFSNQICNRSDAATSSQESTTHFGFRTVTPKEKSEKVLGVFDNVATKYDLMNDAMSFGVHRVWKDYLAQKVGRSQELSVLDVGGGTGDIVSRILRNSDRTVATVCDISENMLAEGKRRAQTTDWSDRVMWVHGNAESLPFYSNSFDLYTIAFAIRNCTNIDKVLSEAYRVLKPGGRFLCLEFSQVTVPGMDKVYDWYSFEIIPVLGHVIAGDWDSYQYLVESIRKFPAKLEFSEMIEKSGFQCVDYEDLSFGIVSIHSGFKFGHITGDTL